MSLSVTDSLVKAASRDREKGISEGCVKDVVETHDQLGWNYIWLAPLFGRLLWVEFREPTSTGEWKHYNKFWWARHGAVISHNPKKLVDAHVKAYVDPKTKFIDLMFWFQTPQGFVYRAAPTKLWYQLEAAFFARHNLCSSSNKETRLSNYVNNTLKEQGLAPLWSPQVLSKPVLTPPPIKYVKARKQRKHRKSV